MRAGVEPSRRRAIAHGAGGGALTSLSVPPFGWWPLAFLGIALLVSAAGDHPSVRRRFALGATFGIGLYAISLWWMTSFSLPGGLFVIILEAAFTGLGLALAGRASPLITVPAGIVLADALRSLWPFGGLPLGGIDLGQAGGPLARLVAFGGRLLLIGVVAAAGSVLVLFLRRQLTHAAISSGTLLSICALSVMLPNGTHEMGSLRVAAVQGGGPRGLRASDQGTIRAYRAHLAATATIGGPVDLILWPEDIVAVSTLTGSKELADLRALAKHTGAAVVVGVVEDGPPGRFINEAVAISPGGLISDRFEKVRRVPYGEFFPFRSLIERLHLAVLPARDAIAGTNAGVIHTAVATFAIAISYEGFFDDRSRGGVRGGGVALLVPTNAASYTTSQVPTQQVAAAQLRALETGRWVVQAAPTGPSAIVDARGRVVQHTVLGARRVLRATISLRSGLTPYAHTNDVPALALTAGALVIAEHRRRRSTARHRADGRTG